MIIDPTKAIQAVESMVNYLVWLMPTKQNLHIRLMVGCSCQRVNESSTLSWGRFDSPERRAFNVKSLFLLWVSVDKRFYVRL